MPRLDFDILDFWSRVAYLVNRAGYFSAQHAEVRPSGRIGNRNRRKQFFGVGVRGLFEHLHAGARFNDLSQVHHHDPVAHPFDDGHVVRDKEIGKPELLLQFEHEVEHRRLNRHVERGDGLVRDDDFRLSGERAGDSDALPLAARKLMGVAVLVRAGDTYAIEQILGPLSALFGAADVVDDERFFDGGADPDARVERGVGVLENELDVSAVLFQLCLWQSQNILAFVEHLALGGDQFQDRISGRRFAAPRFADDAEGFSFIHVEIDILYRPHDVSGSPEECLFGGKMCREVANLQEWLLYPLPKRRSNLKGKIIGLLICKRPKYWLGKMKFKEVIRFYVQQNAIPYRQ